MTKYVVKRTKARRPKQPRTCCPTHNDTCQFGRDHIRGIGNYVDGEWIPTSVICGRYRARRQGE